MSSEPTAPRLDTVVLGRLSDPLLDAVRGVVHDWSAVDLVTRSAWVDIDAPDTVLVVEDGRQTRERWSTWLAVRGRTDLRIVLLQVVGDSAAAGAVDAEAVLPTLARLGVEHQPIVGLVVPAYDVGDLDPAMLLPAMTNVLIQPLDGQHAQAPGDPLGAERSTFVLHAASALATVGALWTDMAAGPFDTTGPAPGTFVRVGRSYARVLDAGDVVRGLTAEVFADAAARGGPATLPHAWTATGEELYGVPPGSGPDGVRGVAGQVLRKWSDFTQFQAPQPFTAPARTAVGFLAAVRMFLSFLGTALVQAPRRFVEAALQRASHTLASGATRMIYGSDSRFEVVVRGVRGGTPDGDPVGDLASSVQNLLHEVAPGSRPTLVDTSALWSELAETTTALADGSTGPAGISLPTHGANRLLVDDPALLAVPPDTPVFRLPSGLVPELEGLVVTADEPYRALRAGRLLGAELAQPRVARPTAAWFDAVQRTLTDLEAWVNARTSLVWAVGWGIAGQLDEARAALADALAVTPPPAGQLEELTRKQRRVRRVVWLALLAMLLLLGGIGLLVGLAVIGPLVAAGLAVLVVLGWLIGSTTAFISAQRDLFQAIHDRETARRKQEWAHAAAEHLAAEVLRLSGVYHQFRLWSTVLRAFVHDPFGGAGQAPAAEEFPRTLSGPLPLAVWVGRAEFDRERQGQLVHEARRRLLTPGWLMHQLTARIGGALEARSRRLQSAQERLVWSDDGLNPHGALRELVGELGSDPDRSQARERATDNLVHWLREAERQRGTEWSLPLTLPRVEVIGDGAGRVLTGAEFLDSIGRGAAQFDVNGFSSVGVTRSAHVVTASYVAAAGVQPPPGTTGLATTWTGGTGGLDRLVVRLDSSDPVSTEHLTYFRDVYRVARTSVGLDPGEF